MPPMTGFGVNLSKGGFVRTRRRGSIAVNGRDPVSRPRPQMASPAARSYQHQQDLRCKRGEGLQPAQTLRRSEAISSREECQRWRPPTPRCRNRGPDDGAGFRHSSDRKEIVHHCAQQSGDAGPSGIISMSHRLVQSPGTEILYIPNPRHKDDQRWHRPGHATVTEASARKAPQRATSIAKPENARQPDAD